ncbi:MAG: TIGR03960 family B12-binding radical SAM protein [Rectinemataceae bacterium]
MRISPLDDLGSRLLSVEKPARYLGGEYGSIRKSGDNLLTFALCFPDLYEIGMSNNAIRILYDRLNRIPQVRCERVFAPAPDFEALLESTSIPLYTLESGIPLFEADILGFSIGYELAATSMLSVLKSGKIALKAQDRGGDAPIVIAGGPAISNPHPFADFLDCAYIGEAEGGFISLLEELAALKTKGAGRRDLLARMSSEPAIWMPAREGENGKAATRALYGNFGNDSYHTAFPVATLKTVQDHGTVEIMRGCPNGCRFCHAGYYYRPQRIKRYADIRSEVEFLVRRGGYREITLASLSSGDYPFVGELLAALNAEWKSQKVSFQLPSLKINSFTLPLLKELSETRKSGLTFAVETPVDEWQRAINKDVSFEQTVSILDEAKAQGFRQAKFYFMLGLPVPGRGEGESAAIVDFFERLTRRVSMQINATLGIFVPKPHTPFQWSPQLGEAEGLSLINGIRSRLKHLRNLKISYHSPFLSYLEGLISRGDERVGDILLDAFARGARLDAWEDRFDRELWRTVLEEAGWDIESSVCAGRSLDDPMPWDDIHIRVSKANMRREYLRSRSSISTSSCMENCNEPCGACSDESRVINESIHIPTEPPLRLSGEATFPLRRMLFQFRKFGVAPFYPHLSIVEALNRAFLVCQVPTAFSEGFNPAPRLEILQPLSIGLASECEIGSLLIDGKLEIEGLSERLNSCLPDGLKVTRLEFFPLPLGKRQRSLGSLLWGSRFEIIPQDLSRMADCADELRRTLGESTPNAMELQIESGRRMIVKLPEPKTKEGGLLRMLERCDSVRPIQSRFSITRLEAYAQLGEELPRDFFSVYTDDVS